MSARPKSPVSSSPFSPRAVLGLVVIGGLAFLAFLWLIGAGLTGGNPNDGQASVGGKGLNGYAAMADEMVAMAERQPGYLGHESARGADGFGITNSFWTDEASIKAWKADESGNLVFRKTARNFNLPAATCGKICVVEVEELVPVGSLDPDCIHLPGVYVQRMIVGAPYDKKIEFRTVRQEVV